MPRRYKPLDECRPLIQQYGRQLERSTDSQSDESRTESSTRRYGQDLRWYDDWLDGRDINSPADVTQAQANQLALDLVDEFSGTTPRQRWDMIYRFHEWLQAMREADENPLEPWDRVKSEELGLTKGTEQERQLEDDERYAPTKEEVRLYEQHVGDQHRTRNQLIIRLLWQTMMRPGELAKLRLDDVDRDERVITIRDAIVKNGRGRKVAYQPSTDALMRKYVDTIRPDRVVGKDHDRLIVGERGGKMSYTAVGDVVAMAAKRADEAHDDRTLQRDLYQDANGQPRRLVSGHSLRHGGATYSANRTDMDIYTLSKILGHSSVEITERRYVADDEDAVIGEMKTYGPE